jgi:hypothetical protein
MLEHLERFRLALSLGNREALRALWVEARALRWRFEDESPR